MKASVVRDSAETQRLLEQVRAGDRQAIDRLLGRHRAYLRQVIQLRMDRKLRSRLDPSDVVQETELEAFGRMSEYLERRPMPFRLWLRKTAHERLLKLREQHVEAARRSVDREMPLPDRSSLLLAQQLLATGPTPSQHLAKRELVGRVRQALAQLAEADREILLMRYLEKLSNQEVGCILELDPQTVSKRHGRALLRLQKVLLESGFRESEL